jgi:hypothetical protein
LIIVQALRSAQTEYVVYFLLSAWLEILEHNGRARSIPADVKSLPVRDAHDVYRRLRTTRQALAAAREIEPRDARALEDVAAAYAVAWDQLRTLSRPHAQWRFQGVRSGVRGGEAAETAPAPSLDYAIKRERESYARLRETPFE